MLVIGFSGQCSFSGKCSFTVLLLLLSVLHAPSLADSSSATKTNKSPWVLTAERGEPARVMTFAPKDKKLEGQALLFWTELADQDGAGPVKVETVLGGLFSELDEYRLMGRKSVSWGQRPSEVVSFQAEVSKRPFTGRLLLTTDGEGPVFALVLLTLSDFHQVYLEKFDFLERHWDHAQPASTNVLYSE